jgi:hypothetical protein
MKSYVAVRSSPEMGHIVVRSAGRTNRNGGTLWLQSVCKWDYCIGAIPSIYCIARALLDQEVVSPHGRSRRAPLAWWLRRWAQVIGTPSLAASAA